MPSTLPLAVTAAESEFCSQAEALATQLKLPYLGETPEKLIDDAPFVLKRGQSLQLCATGRKAPGPVAVDFVSGAVAHRRKFGGGKGQQIAKAVGVRSGFYPQVLDATAGLGRDAFVLASVGCEVRMLERNPVVYALLEDGVRRLQEAALTDRELGPIAARLLLEPLVDSATAWLAEQGAESIPVIYLDPMFPSREKSAKVKKEMVAFHQIVGSDEDADGLLAPALAACYYRTVVKRPRLAPDLAGEKPSLRFEGKSGRFDVYTRHGIPG
ncbi:class I SAM-dependent methyltransferase [Microbulbifer hydrolyticus]|uniref:Ribosomal RNA small subunit methyltransferase J n=1 Tax=Microbulbifer hydrolyticus TaxID=48074 RepID=A0A6P1TBT0_9GAMM|nr:class I SAM-dependent methyltransferase [Microbulbifer hydrolyticus]MBB5210244.1 16S rRNA (guanine1516-N2)-methyltransferase [Microbulbifer hydrolyticus]QHQ39251.1 class I SAM-dependent methyltransferase [Microbulbifer hydrolyticus]